MFSLLVCFVIRMKSNSDILVFHFLYNVATIGDTKLKIIIIDIDEHINFG